MAVPVPDMLATLCGMLLLLRPAACWDEEVPWVPVYPSARAADHTIHPAHGENALLSVCPTSGGSSISSSEVRLRPGTASRCSWTLHSPDGLPVCQLRVAVLSLNLPCEAGSLQIGSELICGGLLGARTVQLPSGTRQVPVTFTFMGSGHKDFDVVVGLEGCVMEEPEVISNHDCGGLYHVAVDDPVGLLSPGYPAQYPDGKNCLYILQHRSSDAGPAACYLDLEFVDFSLESSSGCRKDRLTVDGVDGAMFCGSRGGTTRLELRDRREARLRFLSDDEGTAGGFRVLATLSRCEAVGDPRQETVSPTEAPPAEGAMSELLVPGPPHHWQQCCGRVHTGARFFITSPGFPTGLGGAECVFAIARISPAVCRLRLTLHQFLLIGPCDKHFLEVDGRRICACHSHSHVHAFFHSPQDPVKLLRYSRAPYTAGGFIIEVRQEDCSIPVYPHRPRPVPVQGLKHTFAAATSPWNVTSSIKRSDSALLTSGEQKAESAAVADTGDSTNRSARIMFRGHVRFPDDIIQHPGVTRTESTPLDDAPVDSAQPSLWDPSPSYDAYLDPYSENSTFWDWESTLWNSTSSASSAIDSTPQDLSIADPPQADETHANLDYGLCGAPSFHSWMAQAASWASTVPSALVQCPVGIFPPAKCREFRSPVGWFSSPRYPEPYPNNIRACYRIVRYPSQCGVQVTMLDFDVAPSPTCSKDYLSLGGSSRYCGASLASTLLNLDFKAGGYTDILFVTDGGLTRRGFRAFYRQLPCAAPPPGAPPGIPPIPPPGVPAGVPPGGPHGVPPGVPPGILPGAPPGAAPGVPPGVSSIPAGPNAFLPPAFPPPGAGSDTIPPGQVPVLGLGGYSGARPYPPPFPRPAPVSSGPYQPSGVPERPSTTPPDPPPSPSPRSCGGEIRQQHFAVTSRDVASHEECVFIVRKISEDICGLQVLPERIALDCRREVVVVDGRSLCGQEMQGQTVTLDFYGDSIEIVYRSENGALGAQGDFLFHMQQVADCLELDVTPVARVGKSLPAPACVIELPAPQGVLQAPALEPRPPHHLSCSYAFRQRPGSCYLRLDFGDFLLAAGPVCSDSYLALRNHKYCGEDLRLSSHVFAFSSPSFEVPYRLQRDIPLARWNISYSQIPCQRPER